MGTDTAVIEPFELTQEVDGPAVVATDVRETPPWLIEAVGQVWRIGLDAAANRANAVVGNYLGPDHEDPARRDGLTASWKKALDLQDRYSVVWVNPPYSRGSIAQWCEKAEAEAKEGVTTVMLLPADTSTEAFHRFVLTRRHHFLKRRLKFAGAPLDKHGRLAGAKFGSVLVVFEPERPWTI